ncbi:dipeptidyl peptidase 2-like [Diadema antillarum]|uniref:dipeptidyl peptidase 2-like n=1 Tax=Diadema antillarum TaxID=105358 RepID=UPI003A837234
MALRTVLPAVILLISAGISAVASDVSLLHLPRPQVHSRPRDLPRYRYPYVEKYFDQTVDHFNSESYGQQTFRQRYFLTENYWNKGSGPIFFYTGNEGPLEAFFDNTGFMFDIAPEFEALVVFAEHRYYGKSLPFGNESFTPTNLGLLTVEQALADYATLISSLRVDLKAQDCPVIAFGGSYGGMLSAYMRFKYPHIVQGALAASAPVLSTANQSSQTYFFEQVTKDFHDVDTKCPDIVRAGFEKLQQLADEGTKGFKEISEAFKLCKTLVAKSEVYHLLGWIRNSFTYQAMLDYPYNASFMGSLPANPVNVSCKLLLDTEATPMEGLVKASALYYNSSGTPLKCFDIFTEFIQCADPTGCGLGTDSTAWDYQACTEVTMPAGSTNMTDMFPSMPFTLEMRTEYCKDKYGVVPRGDWLAIQGFGKGLSQSSNIIFSNGLLDPWRGGGITESLSESLVAIPVPQGAHHLDLRGSNPKDPESVIQVRSQEKLIIKTWLDTWRNGRD